jgi:YVTN family beta-propeller protein
MNTTGKSFQAPIGIGLSPDGAFAYVADENAGAVFLIDKATNTATQTIENVTGTSFATPIGVAMSPDGTFAYVTDIIASTVFYIDTATHTATRAISVENHTNHATNIAISPDGTYAYVAGGDSPKIYRIEVATNEVTEVANGTSTKFIFPQWVAMVPNFYIPTPLSINISIQGLRGNNLIFANYLNAKAPASTLKLLAPLQGNALKSALESAAPTRNAFVTYSSQNGYLASSQMASDHLRKQRFHHQKALIEAIAALPNDKEEDLLASASHRSCFGKSTKKKGVSSKVYQPQPYTAWFGPFGEYAREKGECQAPAFSMSLGGAVIGCDRNFEN